MRSLLRNTSLFLITASLLLPSMIHGQCPGYTHKDDVVEGSPSSLPSGWCVFAKDHQSGLYKSNIGSFSESLVPNTDGEKPRSIDISDDGQWIVYIDESDQNSGAPYLIKVDGSGKTTVPAQVISGTWKTAHGEPKNIGFLRQSPKGTELFYIDYYFKGVSRMRAIQVDLSGAVPQFGTDRIIAEIFDSSGTAPDTAYFWPHGGTQVNCVVKDQIFAYLIQIHDGVEALRNGFITIPDGGNGTAGPTDIFQWANDTYRPAAANNADDTWWGCAQTMSHKGRYCLANSGYIGSSCVPNKRDTSIDKMDHKGFYITRFIRSNELPIPIDDQIDNEAYGVSINWCPVRLRHGSWDDVDFNYWNFSNSSSYVIGTLSGNLIDSLGETNSLWVVHWATNTWTKITPSSVTDQMYDPAMYITDPESVRSAAFSAVGFARDGNQILNLAVTRQVKLGASDKGVWLFSLSGRYIWSWHRLSAGTAASVAIPESIVFTGQHTIAVFK